MNSNYSCSEIEKIMSVEGNNICADCGKENPKWASLTNSVFICLECAGLHRNLGVEISFIRSLDMDSWDSKQLKQISVGGNARFLEFLEEYGILMTDSLEKKYLSYACDYYRKLLNSEIYSIEAPQKPDFETGNKLIEIENLRQDVNLSDGKKEKNHKGLLGKIGGFFSGIASKTKKQVKKLDEKLENSGIKDKIKHTGEKTINAVKKTGSYIANTAKKVKNSEFVIKNTQKTKDAIFKLVGKKKVNKEGEPQTNQNEVNLEIDSNKNHYESEQDKEFNPDEN